MKAHCLCLLGCLVALAQNVGIGTSMPGSRLSVSGNLVVGASYASSAVPPNGAAIQGSVGIGTVAPVTGAILELNASDRGFLPTRIALTSAISWSPVIGTPVDGMLVYNTAIAGTGSDAVSPGYYYWRAGRWRRLADNGYAGAIFATLPYPGYDLTTNYPSWQYTSSYIHYLATR